MGIRFKNILAISILIFFYGNPYLSIVTINNLFLVKVKQTRVT